MKVKTLMTASILTMLIGALISVSACANKKLDTAKKVAILHLDKKYKQKFAISKAKYIGQTDTYKLEAYPVDDPNFKFDVFMGGVAGNDISDQFMGTLHSIEARKIAQPYIDAMTKNNYCLATSGIEKNFDEVSKYVYGLNPILTMPQVMDKCAKDISFNVYAYCALDITPENKDQILKDTYKLYKFLKDKKIGYITLDFRFYPEELFKGKDVKKLFEEQLKNGGPQTDYDDNLTKNIFITPVNGNMTNIKSYKDLKNCIYNKNGDKENGF